MKLGARFLLPAPFATILVVIDIFFFFRKLNFWTLDDEEFMEEIGKEGII